MSARMRSVAVAFFGGTGDSSSGSSKKQQQLRGDSLQKQHSINGRKSTSQNTVH